MICYLPWALGIVEPRGWGLGCNSGSAVLVAPEESLHELQTEKLRSGILCREICAPYMLLGFLNKNLEWWKKVLVGAITMSPISGLLFRVCSTQWVMA